MKTYRVSIACKVPINYEVEVNANNENEAVKLAYDKYCDPSDNDWDFSDPIISEESLDIDDDFELDSNTIWIDVTEVDFNS